MKHKGRQLGIPSICYIGTKAQIEASYSGVGLFAFASDINCFGYRNDSVWIWLSGTSTSGGSSHTIQDDGVPLTQRTNLNFVGVNFNLYDDVGNNATIVSGTSLPASAFSGFGKITVGSSAPGNPSVNDLWVDTS